MVMSLTECCSLVDYWITEYARDVMLSCFQNFEREIPKEMKALIYGKLTVVVVVFCKRFCVRLQPPVMTSRVGNWAGVNAT